MGHGDGRRVAPHAGAWIETPAVSAFRAVSIVAPHAGAWIETLALLASRDPRHVAPHAGAWIETLRIRHPVPGGHESHPTRVRGLKPATCVAPVPWVRSHPTRVRGLKLVAGDGQRPAARVAPHAGAWIETRPVRPDLRHGGSHPTRVRGLKHDKAHAAHEADQVAPHAGAWIETWLPEYLRRI